MHTNKELNTVSWMWMLFFIVLGMCITICICLSSTFYYYYLTIDKDHIFWLQKKCLDPTERKHVLQISDVCYRMDTSNGDVFWNIAYDRLYKHVNIPVVIQWVLGIPFFLLIIILVTHIYTITLKSSLCTSQA